MTRDDSRLLVVLGGVSGELEDLGGQIPEKLEIDIVKNVDFNFKLTPISIMFPINLDRKESPKF